MTAAKKHRSSVTGQRKHSRREHTHSHPKGREVPFPADYCEEVSEDYLDALDKHLAAEFEDETFAVVRGPAW
jgi:hypothetical protein